MSGLSEDISLRASVYASRRSVLLKHQLGYGADGTIFSTSVASAVKAFIRQEPYERELACYRRLMDRQVLDVRGHHVPQLINWDDELLIIEMTIVQQPFLLDFASAYLGVAPDFPPEVIEHWHMEKSEQFGERWEDVLRILAVLRGHYGIHLLDVNPGNITFGGGEE